MEENSIPDTVVAQKHKSSRNFSKFPCKIYIQDEKKKTNAQGLWIVSFLWIFELTIINNERPLLLRHDYETLIYNLTVRPELARSIPKPP